MKTELTKTMDYLKSQLNDQAVVTKLQQYIGELESERDWAQQEYSRVQGKLEQTDYELENARRDLKHSGDAVKLYEIENAALREVVRSHAQLAAVMLS